MINLGYTEHDYERLPLLREAMESLFGVSDTYARRKRCVIYYISYVVITHAYYSQVADIKTRFMWGRPQKQPPYPVSSPHKADPRCLYVLIYVKT